MEAEGCIVTKQSEATAMLLASPRPIGIIVISADVGLKNKFVYNTLEKVLNFLSITSSICSVEKLRQLLKETDVVCVSLTPEISCDHKKRHSIVTMLWDAGIKDVYAAYIPGPKMEFRDPLLAQEANALRETLLAHPPNADGLNALIILENGEWEKEKEEQKEEVE